MNSEPAKSTKVKRERGVAMPEMAMLIAMLMVLVIPSIRPLRIGIQGVFCTVVIAPKSGDVEALFDKETGSCYKTSDKDYWFWLTPR